MEIKEFKRTIGIFDNYTINEFVKAIKEAREEVKKYDAIEKEIKDEKKSKGKSISEEEKEEYNRKIQENKDERKPFKEYLSKLERKKKGLISRISKKVQEFEEKNRELQNQIAENKDQINNNEKIMEELNPDSTEYKELEETNNELKKNVSTLEGKMNKIVEKLNKLPRTLSDVENENVVDGLQQIVVRTYKILKEEQEFINEGIPVRDIADEAGTEVGEIEPEAEAETIGETTEQIVEGEETQAESETIEAEISHLEEEIRKTALRIKEYREYGYYDQEAGERANYSKLVERLYELRNSIKAKEESSPRKVVNPPENPAPQPEQGENKSTTPTQSNTTVKTISYKKVRVTSNSALQPIANPTPETMEWHSRLTQEEIDDAISRGIHEPNGPEYEQFLLEHGIRREDIKETNSKIVTSNAKESIWEKVKKFFAKGFAKIKGNKALPPAGYVKTPARNTSFVPKATVDHSAAATKAATQGKSPVKSGPTK